MNVKIFFAAVVFTVLLLVPLAASTAVASKPDAPNYQSTSEPTSTATVTPTESSTSTSTATSTLQPTATITPTETPTSSPTATATLSPTPSVTPTSTPTYTPTATFTPTPTPTLTPTITPTSTPAPTLSPDEIAALACLLSTGDVATNALGVAYDCPSIPVPIRASRAPTAVAVKPTATVTPTPKGDAPSSAMTISDTLLTIDAGNVQWFRIDNGPNFYLDVWLDTSGRTGLTLSLFSPEQTNALSVDLPPKGRGAPVKNEPTHDLLWKGSYATGTWYALVRNYNNYPVQYKIGSSQSTTQRNCKSYWEYLPTGQYVLWTDCGHYTDTSK